MSRMAELHAEIVDQIDDGETFDEIAYNLTCEYPFDFSTAYEMVLKVAKDLGEFEESAE